MIAVIASGKLRFSDPWDFSRNLICTLEWHDYCRIKTKQNVREDLDKTDPVNYEIPIKATIATESEERVVCILLQRSVNFSFSDPGDHRILKPFLTKLQTFPQLSILKYTCKSAVVCHALHNRSSENHFGHPHKMFRFSSPNWPIFLEK